GKGRIEFKQKQLRVRPHPLRQCARMYPFARAVLGTYPRPLKITLRRYSLDQRLRAGNDRGDLEWPFQEPLEKKNAHRECEQFTAAFSLSSSESGWRDLAVRRGNAIFVPAAKRGFDIDSSLYND